jgi:hypothetical protein
MIVNSWARTIDTAGLRTLPGEPIPMVLSALQYRGSRVSFVTKMRSEDGQGKPGRSTGCETPGERLVERTCAWCGEPVAYSGRGRPPRYCTAAHRRRGWELRTA